MKKPFVSALACCVLLGTGLFTPPANAALPAGQEHFTDGDYTFTKVKEIGSAAPLNDHFERGDDVYFSDGRLLMRNSDTEYLYLGDDGELRDLNQGRFDDVFPFSDGLAAVVSDHKVGYMDTQGKLVIPCRFDAPPGALGAPCASYFEDGTAWVFRYREGTDIDKAALEGNAYGAWAQIDKTGKLLTDYSADVCLGGMSISNELYQKYNLFCPAESAMGMVGFDEECTAPNVGTFMARFGPSDTGLTQLPTGKTAADGQPETILYVVSREGKDRVVYSAGRPVFDKAFGADDGYFVVGNAYNSTEKETAGRWGIVTCHKDNGGKYVFGDTSIIEYTVPANGSTEIGFHTSAPVAEHQFGKTSTLNADCRFIYVSLNSDADYDQFLKEIASIGCVLERTTPYGLGSYHYFERTAQDNSATDWLNQNFAAALK